MTKTIMSRAGDFALFVDDQGTTWFYGGTNPIPERISVDSLHLALDIETPVVEFSNLDPAGVPEALLRFQHRSDAVHLSLLLLDDTVDPELTVRAAELLDQILGRSTDAYAHVCTFLHTRALPSQSVARANARVGSLADGPGKQLLADVCVKQSLISRVADAWDGVPTDIISTRGREEICWASIDLHIFDRLVDSLSVDGEIGSLHFELLQDSYLASIPDSRQFISSWFQLIERPVALRPVDFHEDEDWTPPRPRNRRRTLPSRNALESVEKQKKAILDALARNRLRLVERFLRNLEANQMANGGAGYLSKSLCDLATQAQALFRPDYQLFFAQRAVAVAPDDGWAWVQYAHALLQNSRGADALVAYDQAMLEDPRNVVVRNGRAETLRALGRLDEALAAYDLTVTEHPEDVVARGGRAETLRALGRLHEALAAYDQAVTEHPHNPVIRNGRAETLRALGRLDEALAAYDQTVTEHPGDVVARAGRAETLRELGRLDEALAAYDQIVTEYPHNVVVRASRAETLRALGRLHEALAAYDQTVTEHPRNAVVRAGRAETLRALGRLHEALAAYDQTVTEHPRDPVARNGRAETLRALGRLDEALAAYDQTVKEHPHDVVARGGRAETLRELGRLDEALAAYDRTVREHPHNPVIRNSRAETLRDLGRLDEALAVYDQTVTEHPRDAVARNGRAETLRELGRLDEALATYNENIAEHPFDVAARIGAARLLKRMGRLDSALAIIRAIPEYGKYARAARREFKVLLLLSGDPNSDVESLQAPEPKSTDDWTDLQRYAAVQITHGRLAEALEASRKGAGGAPQALQREWFRACNAIALLGSGQHRLALDLLSQIKSPVIEPSITLPLIHAYTRLGDTTGLHELQSRSLRHHAIDQTHLAELMERLALPPDADRERVAAGYEAQVMLLNV